jgi:Holliday junction resolvasome RuvABC endonuclease subunit
LKNLEQLKVRYVLGIDPSGNFKEGKGTTGWSLLDRQSNTFIKCGVIQASKFQTQEAYWLAHKMLIKQMFKDYHTEGIVVSIEDFVLYAREAKAQVNSAMETSQLIGVIKMECYLLSVYLYIRTASQVKRRWADSILCSNGYIYKLARNYYTDCSTYALCEHIRDSMRHAAHCSVFELERMKKK